MLNASKGKGYYSKHLCAQAVQIFYKRFDLFPKGIQADMPAVDDWAAKHGQAMARLEPCPAACLDWIPEAARFRPLAKRSCTSKDKNLQWIRDNLDGVDAWPRTVRESVPAMNSGL